MDRWAIHLDRDGVPDNAQNITVRWTRLLDLPTRNHAKQVSFPRPGLVHPGGWAVLFFPIVTSMADLRFYLLNRGRRIGPEDRRGWPAPSDDNTRGRPTTEWWAHAVCVGSIVVASDIDFSRGFRVVGANNSCNHGDQLVFVDGFCGEVVTTGFQTLVPVGRHGVSR